MAAGERWMISNPSAVVEAGSDTDDADDATQEADRFVDLMKALKKSVQRSIAHQRTTMITVNLPHEPSLWTSGTFPVGPVRYSRHQPLADSYLGHGSSLFVAEPVTSTSAVFGDVTSTMLSSDEPLLHAVAQATDEQKEQIWAVLGVSETIRRRESVQATPQVVSSYWLDEALNVRANPTPISLEDWYGDDSN